MQKRKHARVVEETNAVGVRLCVKQLRGKEDTKEEERI
jgi:hypothetical protein